MASLGLEDCQSFNLAAPNPYVAKYEVATMEAMPTMLSTRRCQKDSFMCCGGSPFYMRGVYPQSSVYYSVHHQLRIPEISSLGPSGRPYATVTNLLILFTRVCCRDFRVHARPRHWVDNPSYTTARDGRAHHRPGFVGPGQEHPVTNSTIEDQQ